MAENEQLTYRKFLLRLRKLAGKALNAYGLNDAKITFINYSGNGLYRIDIPSRDKIEGLYVPGRYALRLHQPKYMSLKHISSELEWLSALRRDCIEVPEPIWNNEGQWVTRVESEYDVPQGRNCTLLRWVDGKMLKKGIRPKHFRSIGKLLGQMHRHSKNWKSPKDFVRRSWDWEGLYGDGAGFEPLAQRVRKAIPESYKEIFIETTNRVRKTMEELGKGKRVYGLIHSDIAIDSNVLFHGDIARPIDFDDSGFGYWIFDLAVPLAHYISDFNDTTPTMRDALIEGYKEVYSLPDYQKEFLDLFIVARYAQEMVWAQAGALQYPANIGEATDWLNRAAKDLRNHLGRSRLSVLE